MVLLSKVIIDAKAGNITLKDSVRHILKDMHNFPSFSVLLSSNLMRFF